MVTDVTSAIIKAKPGIQKYLALMDQVGKVNVSTDAAFQRAYNGFYRVQRRQPAWYSAYYSLMQELKGSTPTFGEVLDRIHESTGRYEPSFSSKCVATLNPEKPVWDKFVLSNTNQVAPSYTSRTKIQDAKLRYADIENWYQSFLPSDEGVSWVEQFNKLVPEHHALTDLKKVDFILWQMRG
jgi:hypothetical protein